MSEHPSSNPAGFPIFALIPSYSEWSRMSWRSENCDRRHQDGGVCPLHEACFVSTLRVTCSSVFDREEMVAAQHVLLDAKPTAKTLSDQKPFLSSLWGMIIR